jgi:hypothetical protein
MIRESGYFPSHVRQTEFKQQLGSIVLSGSPMMKLWSRPHFSKDAALRIAPNCEIAHRQASFSLVG